jgi:hypothetical protein
MKYTISVIKHFEDQAVFNDKGLEQITNEFKDVEIYKQVVDEINLPDVISAVNDYEHHRILKSKK